MLGLKIETLRPELVTARIDMRHELVGHFAYNRVHGGVIAAGLDAMGGLAVMAAIGAPSTCGGTFCVPASAATSRCAPRCCAWARGWRPPVWNLWGRTGS